LRRLQRKLARQERGSKRPVATKTAIAKLKAREADPRKDFVEQTTTALVRDCQACGHEANADVSAAKNILAAGLAVTARGGTSRREGPGEARTQPVAA